MATRKRPRYVDVDGYRIDEGVMPSIVKSAMKYQPQKGDIFVATYPKCGTTWMCHIVLLILNRGKEPLTKEEYFNYCPFLDYFGADAAKNRIKPGCIKTHFPFKFINFSKDGKYIYVARHPKDCVVSFYHHTKLFPNYYFTNGTFDDFFEIFIRGETDFNDYFDNLLSWYEHRNEPNVFFTTFENMKADHRGSVLKVAEFLGLEHLEAVTANNGELLDRIVSLSTVDHMKTVANDIIKEFFLSIPDDLSKCDEATRFSCESMQRAMAEGQESVGEFVRKGKVGEGNTTLSEEQKKRLKKRILEKTGHSDVMSIWK